VTRVLIIVQNLPVPFDRRVWLECQALISDGRQVAVVRPKGGGDPAYEVINTVALYKYRPYAPGGSKLSFVTEYAYSFLATAWLTLRARRSGRFGVIQACNPPDIFWPIVLALRALGGTRFVFDHHDLCPERYESRFPDRPKLPHKVPRALERSTHRTADHVIATNEFSRDLAVTRSGKSEDLRGLPRTEEVHVHRRSWRFWLLVLAGVTAAVTAVATVVLPVARPEKAGSVARPEKVGYNGVGLTPLMGWSTWNYIGGDPTRANVEAQAAALKSSGLFAAGYKYVIIDDDYYECPGSQGPAVDQYGRWVVAPSNFPAVDGVPGLEVVANYVHSLGEKIGFYVTPGISDQAVRENTPIEGTPYTADHIADGISEHNYNCGGMQGINYSKPGAQAFIDSWARELASWGADYIKLDGVGSGDIADVKAWSEALRHTGRPIHLELSSSLPIADASTWAKYSNGWRTGPDSECYCGHPFPLTQWGYVQSRFDEVADWAPYGRPGGFNDYDSIELGDGPTDEGITASEEQSMMSLWAMAASPLVINADLTHLDPTDVTYLKNSAVIAVDQDSIDAKRIVDSGNEQVYAKTEKNGDIILGLFNISGSAETTDTVNLARAGLHGSGTATNLWTGASGGTVSGTYSVTLGAGAVQLLRIVPRSGSGSTTK